MAELSANITLRPTRIGFLVRPTDLAAVRQIMRASTCVWGGVYNPIIPVIRKAPAEWKPEAFERVKAKDVAKGYVQFFEPDVYVETAKGLLEEAGLGALKEKHVIHEQVISFKEFLEPEGGRNWAEPAFGLDIVDVLSHLYKTDQQFVHREKREALWVKADAGSALTEALFGVYPTKKEVRYIGSAYRDVYKPEEVAATADTWRRVFLKGAYTPLRVTRHGLDVERYWHDDLLIFVFDPTRATDLIDLWNLRQEPHPVVPVPKTWFQELANDIAELLKAEHRPIIGNPQGLMHNATIEFSRSTPKAEAEALLKTLPPGLPQGALSAKFWRNQIWVENRDDYGPRQRRMKITAAEKRVELTLQQERELRTTFPTLEPEFAAKYGRGHARWVNILNVSNYGARMIADVLPFNTFDRTWPRLGMGGDPVSVGREGWVFQQQYSQLGQYVSPLKTEDALIGWLKTRGIRAELSEPGHIAKQMLEHLGGLWGAHLLADLETLELLNKMAGGVRRQSNEDSTIEETFERRTAPRKAWLDLIARRKQRRSLPEKTLDDFTRRNIIRLGIETDCPNCRATNWSTLSDADYKLICERCLKPYDFPQAELRDHNRNWTYRVVGPFSMHDYGRGSYSALLALNVIDRWESNSGHMTYATAMNLTFAKDVQREVDFICWKGDNSFERSRAPQLVIGECKSLGKGELIKSADIAALKLVASKLPDATIAIAVLRDHFTAKEKKLLKKLVAWGRRVNSFGQPTNPVLLLTSHELLMDFHISSTWKKLGGEHAKYTDHHHLRNLRSFANATQQIYLGMPSFHQDREAYWKKRDARRKAKQSAQQQPKQ